MNIPQSKNPRVVIIGAGFAGLSIAKKLKNKNLQVVLNHKDGSIDMIIANHTYNEQQIEWFRAGGALNVIRMEAAK